MGVLMRLEDNGRDKVATVEVSQPLSRRHLLQHAMTCFAIVAVAWFAMRAWTAQYDGALERECLSILREPFMEWRGGDCVRSR
jgi:hypothetical protein